MNRIRYGAFVDNECVAGYSKPSLTSRNLTRSARRKTMSGVAEDPMHCVELDAREGLLQRNSSRT